MSPDPIYPGRQIFYSEANGVYWRPLSPNTSEPIYFEGTDPRNPGVPPPDEAIVVGTPREQFEKGLTVEEWLAYMDVIGQHNM